MNSLVLETDTLCKNFGEKRAVDAVNLHVQQGDIYGFIGKNGAGKTTTMKMILGLTKPSGGRISLFGSSDLQKGRRRVGSLIEAPGLYPEATAMENLMRVGCLLGTGKKEAMEALRLVGLDKTGKKKAKEFSLGMKQRLGIAIAILGAPEFLVLDEPINGLDPEAIKQIRDLILYLNKEKGVTMLISSHLLDELSKVVTRYGIIDDGRLLEEITPEELKSRSQHGLYLRCDRPSDALRFLKRSFPKENALFSGERIELESDVSFAPRINRALVEAGFEVYELAPLSGDLEDYFLKRIG